MVATRGRASNGRSVAFALAQRDGSSRWAAGRAVWQGAAVAADDTLRRLRLRAQRLEPRSRDGVLAAVRDVCGIQAQDARAARLSVRARCRGRDGRGCRRGRRRWSGRGRGGARCTCLPVADLGWVLPLVAPPATRSVGARWRQLGLDEDVYARAREVIVAALASGPRTRAELREALAAAGIDASGQRLPHLVARAAREGLLHHPLDGTFAAPRPAGARPREEALAELGRRYAAAFGPAGERDLAKWSGLPAADVRGAWAAVEAGVGAAAEAEAGDAVAPDGPAVRLLPAFDTYLLGYADRADVVPPEHAARVFPGGGWIHPVVLVDGLAAGTWRLSGGAVEVEPFAPLTAAVRAALEPEIADVERFLS